MANDMYHQLIKEGFKVFFSRITLEDKIGTAYEPYIFAALNSAKVMVVLGTKKEYFNAVWVRNEWSRYMALIRAGAEKTLVPAYRDMDPYDLPEEFAFFQARDMGELGFMQDLINEIRGTTGIDVPKTQIDVESAGTEGGRNIYNLTRRAQMFMEDGDFERAYEYLDRVLDINAEYAPAYVGKVQAAMRLHNEEDLRSCLTKYDNTPDWQKAIRFAEAEWKERYIGYALEAKEKREGTINELLKQTRLFLWNGGFDKALESIDKIINYDDECAIAYVLKTMAVMALRSEEELGTCLNIFEDTPDWKNAMRLANPEQKERFEKYVLNARKTRQDRRNEITHGRPTLVAGTFHTVGLKRDGTVLAVGENTDDQCDVKDWSNIIEIAAYGENTVGLKSNGTVVAKGLNDDNFDDWTDIVAVSSGAYHTIGLKSNGTVVAVGDNDEGQCNVDNWTDIVAIAGGEHHTLGVKSDGSVLAVGHNFFGECNVGDWEDMIAVQGGESFSIGLKSNGTVVTAGECFFDVDDWTDIIAIASDCDHLVGLKSDGTVVAVGANNEGQCDVDEWTDIVEIAAGCGFTVGLRLDGTVIAVGDNEEGQCNVQNWKNIKLPASTQQRRM